MGELSDDGLVDARLSDFELEKTDEELARPNLGKPLPRLVWIAVLVLVAGVPGYVWFPRTPEAPVSNMPLSRRSSTTPSLLKAPDSANPRAADPSSRPIRTVPSLTSTRPSAG